MPSLTAATATENHRRAQGRLAAATVADMLTLWSRVDPFNLAGTVDGWLTQVLDLIRHNRATSISLAQTYFLEFRTIELGRSAGPAPPPAPDNPQWPKAAAASLLATGPSRVKTLSSNGIPPVVAADKAGPEVAAAAARHVTNGGRSHVERTARTDRRAVGYRRVTSDDPCFWCAMLAGREVLYASEESARDRYVDGQVDTFHTGCNCQIETVYRYGTPLSAQSQAHAALWETAVKDEGHKGKAAVRAFRRAYYAQQRDKAKAAAAT
ncbi:hypothetical protein [Kutzneria sp. NPDC051319]|uniref:VG15 protein n=1 Tax=Kutzneria sp. NPDC051319 TaxID=3155047 RepID=UPI003448B44A